MAWLGRLSNRRKNKIDQIEESPVNWRRNQVSFSLGARHKIIAVNTSSMDRVEQGVEPNKILYRLSLTVMITL
jgi:hypothetical protein